MKLKKDWTREHLEKHYIGKMTATTIPVNISISGKQKILDMSQLEIILREAEVIAQEECYCRKKMGNCNDPMDGCLSLDKEALDAIEKDGAKRITVEEALSAMKRTYDAGFVHMAYVYDGKDKPEIICSCCRCCCHSLSAALRFGYSDHVFYSEKIASQDNSLCDNCGACVDRCQFEARKMDKEELLFEPEKCAGCGLCLLDCPTEAITIVERERIGS